MEAAGNSLQSHICISFALPQEYAPFRRSMRSVNATLRAGCSGAGVRNAKRHVSELLADEMDAPVVLMVCGFAGALGPHKAGDIVIANRVIDCTGRNGTNTEYHADSRLLATVESVRVCNLPTDFVTLATTDRILLNRQEKQAFLARCNEASCVDMETAGALQIATERGIPWLSVRAITDSLNEAMPFDFNALADDDGNVALARVIAAALTHPGKIPALLQLGKRSTLAANNLTRFLAELLPLMPTRA